VAFGEQAMGRVQVFGDVFPKFRSRVTSVEDAICQGNTLIDESLILVFILYTVLKIAFFFFYVWQMNYSNVSLIFLGEGASGSKVQVVVEKFPNTEEFELTKCAG
jgi:hypothetical protein